MRFLLRMAFWLTVILVLLPSGGSQTAPKSNVSAIEAMSAARATVNDMGSFCERQPDACAIGSQAAVAIGHRAQAGAKMLYEYLNDHLATNDGETGTNAHSGKALPMPLARRSRRTRSRRPIWLRLGAAFTRARKRAATLRPDRAPPPSRPQRLSSAFGDRFLYMSHRPRRSWVIYGV